MCSKKEKMNCEEIKEKISIRMVLESFNLFPVKENRNTAFYFALIAKNFATLREKTNKNKMRKTQYCPK